MSPTVVVGTNGVSRIPDAAPNDTIVALSTAPGDAALAVVRLSGPDAVRIADRIFSGKRPLSGIITPSPRLGMARTTSGGPIDQVLATVMRAPRSYTGEDVVEISSHGGNLVSRLLVEAALSAGARPADPGEFTRRAFLNGRMDLTQAEAVTEIIHARGERALKNALAQLDGGLSARLSKARGGLLDILAPIEAHIDFGEDVPEPPGGVESVEKVARVREELEALLAGSRRGQLLSDGARVVLAGKPNVGKSSILNAMAGHDRAIVHSSPGTTRDTIEATVDCGGIPVTLTDTAGLRTSPDPVEEVGVARARQAVEAAHLVLLVVDGSVAPDDGDNAASEEVKGRDILVVRNKSDLGNNEKSAAWSRERSESVHAVSASEGSGIVFLVDGIRAAIERLAGADEGLTMTRARHYEALGRAADALRRAEAGLRDGVFADMTAAELRDALSAVGEVTGESVGPDILDRIFRTFCIGK